MHSTPLISILLPIYNVGQYLELSLKSILNQSYQNLEIVLVDDGSTDNSGGLCDLYASKDVRIKVIHQKNGGVAKARNTALDHATGEYYIFVDPDDGINKFTIEYLYNIMLREKAAIVGGGLLNFHDDNEIENFINADLLNRSNNYDYQIYSKTDIWANIYNESFLPSLVVVWNKLYVKDVFDNLRFPEGKVHEDEYLIHHIYNKANKIVIANIENYYYRLRKGSITKVFYVDKQINAINSIEDRLYFSEKHHLEVLRNSTMVKLGEIVLFSLIVTNYPKELKEYYLKYKKYVWSNFFKTDYFNYKEKLVALYKLLKY